MESKEIGLVLISPGLSVAEQPQQGTMPLHLQGHVLVKHGVVPGSMAGKVRYL